MLRFHNQTQICSEASEKSDLATLICAAGHRRSLFTLKRGCGLQQNKMTTPTMTRKVCPFFFTRLDRSYLSNLDRSRFEKERNHGFSRCLRRCPSCMQDTGGQQTLPGDGCQVQRAQSRGTWKSAPMTLKTKQWYLSH